MQSRNQKTFTMTAQLKQEYREKVSADQELIGKIAAVTKKKVNTIVGWLDENSVSLCRVDVLTTIQQRFNLDDYRELTELVQTEKA